MVAAKRLILALSQVAWAWNAPARDGYTLVWQDTFVGAGGSTPSPKNWHIETDIKVNNELQQYTTSNRNLQLSGGETLQIVPWREGNSGWTSARIESKYVFTPEQGRRTAAEASIRFGANSASSKKGLWPAFWLLGDALRHGTPWPASGEIDIFESVNGAAEAFGTVHCDVDQGGACDEPTGRGATVAVPDLGWHTWRVEWDRGDADWRRQSIEWFCDGVRFHVVTGEMLGSESVWASLAHSPMYFILNVAIGGNLVSFFPLFCFLTFPSSR